MTELVQVTAQYSNAVLLAVLPHVSAFVQKLDLPLHTPITPAQILHFKCDPRKDHVGGMVTLTNRFQFTFLDGRICVYRSPLSYFSLQDLDISPDFYGRFKLTENEAIRIAHQALKKLGYTDSQAHANTEPAISRPETLGKHVVPRYRITWLGPQRPGTRTPSNPVPAVLDIEVNAENSHIEMLSMSSRETQRPDPTVGVHPPLAETQPKGPGLLQNGSASWASKEYAGAMLTNLLPLISDFVSRARLPLRLPITTNDISPSNYTCVFDQGGPVAQLYLKNGDRFNFTHGHVSAYYAHDAFLKFPEMGRVQDYLGKINISTNEAISFSKELLGRLGCTQKLNTDVGPPCYVPSENFTRFFITYTPPNQSVATANFEIDLRDKSVKSIFLDDPSLWRTPPKIDIPGMPIHAQPPVNPDGAKKAPSVQPVASAPPLVPRPSQTNYPHEGSSNLGVIKRTLTPEERADLEATFSAKIKPAVVKWCSAYAGHLHFPPEALTIDKFKEKIGRSPNFTIYTFMLGSTTLCFQDSNGRVVVNYLSAPEARQLMQFPAGTPPTMEMPVTRTDIIKMVKQDSGTEFKPADILLKPAGAATALNGGALVDIAPLGGDPNNGLCKLSLVFDHDGALAYYCRDPSL
jgi:hypothetical protein